MMINIIKKPRHVDNYPLFLVIMFILAFMVMIIRNMFINNATVFGDEYIYKELSKHFFDDVNVTPVRGLLFAYPDFLYLSIFYFSHYFQENFLKAAQILNSLFFCLALFPIYGVARLFVKPAVALLIGLCALISPFGAHTAYFMPEAMYYFVFWVFVYSFLKLIGHRPGTAGLLSGVILGLLFLIKPHAIFILVATNLALLTFYLMRSQLALKTANVIFR